jgi:hypothetical protein
MLYSMIDASSPPASAPSSAHAVAGYIGPVGNTPHVWTLEEWRRFGHLRQFPIWVGAGRADGLADGRAAVAEAKRLGWAAHRPNRRYIICDVEAQAMAEYLDGFAAEVWDGGFQTEVYESLTVVHKNPVKEGIWLADWDGIADLPAGVIAHQYRPDVPYQGTEIDVSVISEDMLTHGGEGPRQ